MTPLAHKIAKQASLPRNKRTFDDPPMGLLRRICDAHCFETTAVLTLARQLTSNRGDDDPDDWTIEGSHKLPMMGPKAAKQFVSIAERTAFLPAPITWIEFQEPGLPRDGFLLVEDQYRADGKEWITVFRCDEGGLNFSFSFPKRESPLDAKFHPLTDDDDIREHMMASLFTFATIIIANLAIINTPKIIGRVTHLPHVGLEKRLGHAYQMPGRYPLQAWHEVLLKVSVPAQFDDETVDGHLTGTRALHFCRSYLRIRMGHLELVNWHWRGNPALGLKQTRYRVVP